jgi:ketosteroid isomerase-like protein
MKRLILLAAMVLMSAPAAADTQSELRAVLDYFVEVWNENDTAALSSYYHSDFVMINDEGTVSRERFLEDVGMIGNNGGDRGTLEQANVRITPLGGDHAMAYGLTTLTFEDGSKLQNWFTTVYVKTPFGWKALLTRN